MAETGVALSIFWEYIPKIWSNAKSNLQKACSALLRPLVKLLLRSGIGYSTFGEWVKHVYVEVAEEDFALPNRMPTGSRIAVLTGLHRKEVARIRKHDFDPVDTETDQPANRAERIVRAWMREPEFLDPEGEPLELPISGDKSSFQRLVKVASGDIYPTTILDELQRVGAVELRDKDFVTLKRAGYVPAKDSNEKLRLMGDAASDLLTTLEHNLNPDTGESRMQLSVTYDNLPPDVLAEFSNYEPARDRKITYEIERMARRT